MSASILITGASGFIGSHLVEYALSRGYETWAAVRPSSSHRYLTDPRIRFIELNLGNPQELALQLQKHATEQGPFDHVIHAAGATKCRCREDFFRVNTRGTEALAKALTEAGALRPEGRFVFISSLSVMGPLHEKDGLPLSADEAPQPDTAYGESKLQAERLLARIPGLNYVILRPTGVYGPREKDYMMMADSIRRHVDFAVGYRPQTLTFIYVSDLVEAAFSALTKGTKGTAYLLTDGCEYTSRTFSDLLQKYLGVRFVCHIKAPLWFLRLVCMLAAGAARLTGKVPTLNPDKYRIMRQRNWRADITPARLELGYNPQWPLERGVPEICR